MFFGEFISIFLYDTAYFYDESNWIDDVLYIGNHLIQAKVTISGEYVIKEGTVTISNYAFNNCKSLTSVVIPNSVVSIGDSAFLGCYSLTDVYYTGTEEEWKAITIDEGDAYLTDANIHYNYVPK